MPTTETNSAEHTNDSIMNMPEHEARLLLGFPLGTDSLRTRENIIYCRDDSRNGYHLYDGTRTFFMTQEFAREHDGNGVVELARIYNERNPMTNINKTVMDDKIDENIPTATNMIYDWIGENFEDFDGTVLRCSAASGCVRKRWYQGKGTPGLAIAPRARINFLAGDIGELCMKHFVKHALVGEGKLYSETKFGVLAGTHNVNGKEIEFHDQIDLSFNIGDNTVTGHADGFGKRNSDDKWELIEFKTSSNWGFKKFQETGPDDYIRQAHALMLTDCAKELKAEEVRFFYMKKETGHLWDRLIPYDQTIADEVVDEFAMSVADEVPAKPFELVPEMTGRAPNKRETGRKTCLSFPCGYCPYIKDCHGEYDVEYKKNQWGNLVPNHIFK